MWKRGGRRNGKQKRERKRDKLVDPRMHVEILPLPLYVRILCVRVGFLAIPSLRATSVQNAMQMASCSHPGIIASAAKKAEKAKRTPTTK